VKRYALNKCADTYTGENITGTMEGGINFMGVEIDFVVS
jgi:hypothetical protein